MTAQHLINRNSSAHLALYGHRALKTNHHGNLSVSTLEQFNTFSLYEYRALKIYFHRSLSVSTLVKSLELLKLELHILKVVQLIIFPHSPASNVVHSITFSREMILHSCSLELKAKVL